jgi:membrane associated rhomboid family serine protease/Zn-finger nucleic acid-binding protein
MTAPLACPFDGFALDAAGDCRRCGAAWRSEADVAARGASAFRRLAPDETSGDGPSRTLSCPACRTTLAPRRLDKLDVWLYRCPSCAGWLCPRGTLGTLARVDAQARRQAAFESFSPEERAAMAREIAAEAAASAPDAELPPVHAFLALLGLPVVTRIRRERLPLATWALAIALIAVFVVEARGAGVDDAVARLAYGPHNRGLRAALTATFVHGGVAHLIGNVYFLLAFGDGAEQRVPRWLLAPGFVVAGVLALLVDGALHPASVLVGASGGVAAVVGACVVLQPRARIAIQLGPFVPLLRLPIVGFFVVMFAFQILMAALRVSGVAWTAHVVGLALGAGGALLLRTLSART